VDAAPGVERWSGVARLGLGWATYRGPVGDNAPHAHHAVQIAVGLDAPLAFELDGVRDEAPGIVFSTDRRHRLLPGSGDVGLVYVEGESGLGLALGAACANGQRALDGDVATHLGELITRGEPGDNVVATLLHCWQLPPALPQPASALGQRLRQFFADADAVSPESGSSAIAARLGVSASRLRHVFRDATGMAVRPYLRWRRLLLAAGRIADGASLTTAAHDAGFADAAHLSRTFRRHFGMAPSALLGRLVDAGEPVRSSARERPQRR
jgi:AraC-like DNA-binding protein